MAAFLTAQTVSGALVHRYSFTSDANDSVGTAHGTAAATPAGSLPTFSGGQVTLDGQGGYIDLPNGLFSTLTNVTIEAWVTVNANANWARIFDFGTSTVGETRPDQAIGTGLDYMFLTPNGANSGNARFAITDNANGQERPILNDPEDFPLGTETHVAVVYGPPVARLYVGGKLVASGTAVIPLSELQDNNNWLGRSQWADPMFDGSFNEFRIHDSLIGGPELKASQLGGPNATNYDPGTVTAVTLTANASMLSGGTQTPVVTATFTTAGQITLSPGEMTLTSSATNVVQVTAAGTLQAKGIGVATITASRGGQSATAVISVSPSAPAVLKHRYSFDGPTNSTTVVDSVGGKNGEIKPPNPTAAVANPSPVILTYGQAFFPSGTGWDSAGYIDLPNGLISSKTNITIETWVTWNGPNNNASQNWSRIFDFGDSSKGEDAQSAGNGSGLSYLFITPRANGNTLRFEAIPQGGTALQLNVSPSIAVGQETHLVLIYAPTLQTSRLYVNGALGASGSTGVQLSQVNDINNWLGASQWQGDLPYYGFINEFRIYEGPLTDLEVALSRSAGPNALAAAPGALQTVSLNAVTPLLLGNPTATQAALLGNFENTKGVNVTSVAGITFASSDTNIFTVSATGGLLPRNVGNASLISSFQGMSATTAVSVTAPIALRHDLSTNRLNAGGPIVSATLRADFPGATNVNVNGYAGVARSSSNTNVLTIAANGNMTAITAGDATITSTFAGLTAKNDLTVTFPAGYQPGKLAHRYSFDGPPNSSVVTDSVGSANGEVIGGDGTANAFTGTGQLALAGSAWNAPVLGGYVNLPNGIVSKFSSVTLEGWANYRGGAANQRFFDFGMSSGAPDAGGPGIFGEDAVANPGRSYMFLTPAAGPRFAINQGTAGENPSITSSVALTLNTNSHFAVVYDPVNGVARLYVNGRRTGTAAATQPLSTVDDRNAWLGRSVWQDPLLNGVYDEFRIYNGPLSDADIAASFAAGPNALITPGQNEPKVPSTNIRISSVTLSAGNLRIEWTGGGTLESATNISGPWTAVTGAASPYSTPLSGSARFFRVRQ